MAFIRRARVDDLIPIENCHLMCLSRRYNAQYYMLHFVTWPELQFVAHDRTGHILGFILARIKQRSGEHRVHGTITCFTVRRTHNNLDLYRRFIFAVRTAMQQVYRAAYLSVTVRRSDPYEFDFFTGTLGFEMHALLLDYYMHGEDGCELRIQLDGNESHRDQPDHPELDHQQGGECCSGEVESEASDNGGSTSEPETNS